MPDSPHRSVHQATPIQAEKEALGPCHWRLSVRVPQARIHEEFDHVYRHAAAQLKVPGFRPGKIPAAMARQLLGDSAKQQAREHLFEHVLGDAIRAAALPEEPLRVVGFEPGQVEVSELSDLELSFEVLTQPNVALPDWSEVEVAAQDAAATPEQIEEGLLSLGQNHPRFDPVEGGEVDDRHLAAADLVYALDGASGPEAKDLKVGPGAPLYGSDVEAWDAAVRGRKAGDCFTVEVDFHEGFSEPGWVGKRGVATVQVREIVAPRVATPAELAAEMGLEGEDQLRERLGAQIARENQRRERDRQADAALERVVALRPFELPATLVDEETEAMVARRVEQMKQAGATQEQADEAAAQHRDEVRRLAEQRLKHWFVIRAVARAERVRVSEGEVDGALRALAMRQGVDPADLRRWFEQEGRLDQLRGDILQEKARARLLELAVRESAAAPNA